MMNFTPYQQCLILPCRCATYYTVEGLEGLLGSEQSGRYNVECQTTASCVTEAFCRGCVVCVT